MTVNYFFKVRHLIYRTVIRIEGTIIIHSTCIQAKNKPHAIQYIYGMSELYNQLHSTYTGTIKVLTDSLVILVGLSLHSTDCTGAVGDILVGFAGVCSFLLRRRDVEFGSGLIEVLVHKWRLRRFEMAAEK